MKLRALLSATALASSFAIVPSVAFGQVTAPPTSNEQSTTSSPDIQKVPDVIDQTGVRPDSAARAEAETDPSQDIVVTGTRLSRPGVESTAPLTSLTADDLLSTGKVILGDALNDLPALRSTFSQSNSTRFIGTSGLNFLDLRGLGTSRTLVLVNGRRHISSSPGDYVVDVNTIPADLLDRTDIITGGQSAIYGSDAIAGVVNFILKRDYQGIKLNGQASISDRGDRAAQFVSGVVGRNFADGRGNIAFAAEYVYNDPLFFTERDRQTGAYRGRTQYNLTTTTAGEPAAGNGIADNTLIFGARNGAIADSGLIQSLLCTTAAANAAALANPAICRQGGNAPNTNAGRAQRYVFDNAGNFVLSNPVTDLRDITAGGSTNTIGGLGSTLRNTGQLNPKNERFTANVLAHFDISDAFKPFVEAKYVRINVDQEGQPSFFSPISGTLGLPNIRCDNAFLNAQARSVLTLTGNCPAALNATSTFAFNRFNVDFGGRAELQKRETWRVVGGVEGTFNDDWKYEISGNYGEYTSYLRSLNNLILTDVDGNLDGFSLAYDAALAPATFTGSNFTLNSAGQRVICRVNVTTNVSPNCVPLNLFGLGNADPRALAFSQTTTTRQERASELDILAFVSGDLSQLFELPGGPVAFSVGGEYRRETAFAAYDELVQAGGTFLNAIQPFVPPAFEVKEAYGELQVPILKDVPFFKELTAQGAVRYSDYNTSAGNTTAYNAGLTYTPFRGIRFRGTYSRSVRVPTQSDLFSTPSQNFAQIADPCDVLNVNNGSNRAANCAAAGVPVGFVNTPARTATLSFLQGGNSLLTAETSDSYTVGAVFTPGGFLRGFSLTVDYFDITVNNLIATLGAQTIINQCYDLPNLNNPYCALVFRNADSTFADPAVLSGPVNFAKLKNSGIDVDAAYNRRFSNGDSLGFRFIASYIDTRTNFISPTDPNFGDRVKGELGDPELEFTSSIAFKTGPLSLNYRIRYIDKMTKGAYETQFPFQGRPPTNADAFEDPFYKSRVYNYARVGLDVGKNYQMYFGVDNLFDVLPPDGLLGNGAGDSIYDNVGRYFYAGFKVEL